ncbi:MAG: hypothetical protein V4492_06775 [Chlamydiota bacterium]
MSTTRLSDPIVVSFYTEGTPYQLEVMHLIESCTRHGIESSIVGVPSKGAWELNCAIKPFFIRDQLLEKKRPVFWVDADAVFKKRPDFSPMLHADLAFREMKRFSHDRRLKIFSGSMFVNYNPRTVKFVEEWCKYCEEQISSGVDLQFLDQTSLIDLIDRGADIKLFSLPIPYSKVFDLDALEVQEHQIVVEHYQASRRYRWWKG